MSKNLYVLLGCLLAASFLFIAGFLTGKTLTEKVIVESTHTDSTRTKETETIKQQGETTIIEVPVPVPFEVEKTVYICDDTGTLQIPINRYVETYADSNLTATFETQVAGTLESWKFTYTPFYTTIREKEFIEIKTETVLFKPLDTISFGAHVMGFYPHLAPIEDLKALVGPRVIFRPYRGTSFEYSFLYGLTDNTMYHAVDIGVDF